jgi:hypothetical protein
MNTLETPQAYGSVVFCDDIRVENTAKELFIGVYSSGVMNVHRPFPLVLPKLCVAISYFERADKLSANIKFQIYLPTDTPENASYTAEMEIDQQLTLPPPELPQFGDEPTVIIRRFEHRVILGQLQLKEPGIIRVRAENDFHRIRLGSLSVRFEEKKDQT